MELELSTTTIPPRRILAVDDEASQCFALRMALRKLPNCEVVTAPNAEGALQLVDKHSFDLLITDYRMPGMDGLTLARQVREHSPRTKIILMTAYGNAILRRLAGQIEIHAFLDKPVKIQDIRAAILDALK